MCTEKRISSRLDDCFAQLSTSLDLYKNVRSLCKDAGDRTRNAEVPPPTHPPARPHCPQTPPAVGRTGVVALLAGQRHHFGGQDS